MTLMGFSPCFSQSSNTSNTKHFLGRPKHLPVLFPAVTNILRRQDDFPGWQESRTHSVHCQRAFVGIRAAGRVGDRKEGNRELGLAPIVLIPLTTTHVQAVPGGH